MLKKYLQLVIQRIIPSKQKFSKVTVWIHTLVTVCLSDIDKSLAAGKPVVIGILHRGSLSAPTGGHMCVVIGTTPDGKGYYVNDPYGSLNDSYTGPVTNGKKTVYTKAVLKHRWCPGGKDGWGRIFD